MSIKKQFVPILISFLVMIASAQDDTIDHLKPPSTSKPKSQWLISMDSLDLSFYVNNVLTSPERDDFSEDLDSNFDTIIKVGTAPHQAFSFSGSTGYHFGPGWGWIDSRFPSQTLPYSLGQYVDDHRAKDEAIVITTQNKKVVLTTS